MDVVWIRPDPRDAVVDSGWVVDLVRFLNCIIFLLVSLINVINGYGHVPVPCNRYAVL